MLSRLEHFHKPLLACLAALFCSAGCASGPPKIARQVDLGLSRDVPATTVKVDLVGVNRADLPQWAGVDLNRYWQPAGAGEAMRATAVRDGRLRSVTLGGGDAAKRRVVIGPDNSVWKQWSDLGVDRLVVLTDLPAEVSGPPQPGAGDRRRRIFTLDPKGRDAAGPRITLRVGLDGMVTLSQ